MKFHPYTLTGAVLLAILAPFALAQSDKMMRGKTSGAAHIQMPASDKTMMTQMMSRLSAGDRAIYGRMSLREKMLVMKLMKMSK